MLSLGSISGPGRTGEMAPALAAPRPCACGTELRQLRHLTKNALQRILAQAIETPGIETSAAGRRLAREIERRIRLSAAISDALFGLTGSPGAFAARFGTLCRSVIDLYADPAQVIGLKVALRCSVPGHLEGALLGIAHELVGNAVKHGFHMRLIGEVAVSLENDGEGSLLLTIANDGWPIAGDDAEGEGLGLVRALAAEAQGEVGIRSGRQTAIAVRLPLGARA